MHRLISFIVIFALFLAFIVLNLEQRSDISLGFVVFRDTPVFLGVFFSFVLGMLFSIPLFLGKKKNKNPGPAAAEPKGKKEKKKKPSPFWARKKGSDSGPSGPINYEEDGQKDHIKKENGLYGID